MEHIRTLEDLLHSRLDDIHVTNSQMKTMLPLAAQRVSNPELKERLAQYMSRSEAQNRRIEQLLTSLDWTPTQGLHHAASGLMQDMSELLDTEGMKPTVMDAAVLATVQRLQHHHIADFGCLRTWAKLLGHDKPAELLQECLDEEKISDGQLTALANDAVNQAAAEVNVGAEVR